MADFDPNQAFETPKPQVQEKQPNAQVKPPTAAGPAVKAPPPPPPQYLLDTLNETVGETIWRDLKMILLRTYQVVWIFGKQPNREVYEQWDVFGPLLYSLALGLLYYFTYVSSTIKSPDFILPTVICVIFGIGFVVALNMILIGAKANIMGTIALLGYCVAPLVLGAIAVMILVMCQIKPVWICTMICALISGFTATWCLFATYGFFKNLVPQGKIFLGVYPVFFFFIILAVLMVIPALG
ncbi:Yip1_protein [Hexamita inflata]|uniref:Protein YIPF n=1 Tax=Hexamita inflata TaxID=28002 RepID=A0AA86NFP5_9EUKA|nr:Yip1 protein [Hexamita inflata]CAI9920328.1 Yip1 protein [Hexamita inflata]